MYDQRFAESCQDCLCAYQIDLHETPAFSYMPAYIYALTYQHTRRNVLGLGVAAGQERALHDAAEKAVRAVMHIHDEPTEGIGSGKGLTAALTNSIYALLEAYALPQIDQAQTNVVQIADWHAAVIDPALRAIVDAFRAIQGEIQVYLYPEIAPVPLIAATLRLPHPPYALYAGACDLAHEGALGKAIERLLYAFYGFELSAQTSQATDEPWLEAARYPDAVVRIASSRTTVWSELERPALDELDRAPLALLRRRLHEAGYAGVPAYRQLYPQHESAPHTLTIVQTTISGMPHPSLADSRSVWLLPAVTNCVLSRETLLGYNAHDVPLSRLYHENSKLQHFYRGYPLFSPHNISAPVQQVLAQSVKDYHHTPLRYDLPEVRHHRTLPLEACILRRRSWKPLDEQPLSLQSLAHILYFSYGVTEVLENKQTHVKQFLRAAPSAGALYPIDVYLLLQRVEGVETGLYYYHPLAHQIQLVRRDLDTQAIAQQTGYSQRVEQAAAVMILVGSLRRNQWKYRDRGYRMILLDCGHVAQNVLLAASGVQCVGHPIMGFADDYFNDLLRLDGIEEVVLYLLILGAERSRPSGTDSHLPAFEGEF